MGLNPDPDSICTNRSGAGCVRTVASLMKIKHKAPWYQTVRSSVWGLLWTKHGLQIVRPGDYIVRAPTGCTWRLRPDTVNEHYDIQERPAAPEPDIKPAISTAAAVENHISNSIFARCPDCGRGADDGHTAYCPHRKWPKDGKIKLTPPGMTKSTF